MPETKAKNRKTAAITLGVVAGMVGLSFASVPLYRAFCQITGFDGTTKRADKPADRVLARKVTIRFDATVGQGLPWSFKPEQVSQTLHVGETGLAFYAAENFTSRAVSGRASFNVQPAKAGQYFRKIECFCFTEQTLKPREKVSMPVTYFIDPAIADDEGLDDVQTITLSYTFFPWEDDDVEVASAANPAIN
ncbi:MAG: cytochrome c oxidase assembly protein [Parvularculaceae bacterium]